MGTYQRSGEGERGRIRCAVCDATVIAEAACAGRTDANTVCVKCGMMVVEPPFEDCDYFDVIMRVGRPLGRAAWLRRTR